MSAVLFRRLEASEVRFYGYEFIVRPVDRLILCSINEEFSTTKVNNGTTENDEVKRKWMEVAVACNNAIYQYLPQPVKQGMLVTASRHSVLVHGQ